MFAVLGRFYLRATSQKKRSGAGMASAWKVHHNTLAHGRSRIRAHPSSAAARRGLSVAAAGRKTKGRSWYERRRSSSPRSAPGGALLLLRHHLSSLRASRANPESPVPPIGRSCASPCPLCWPTFLIHLGWRYLWGGARPRIRGRHHHAGLSPASVRGRETPLTCAASTTQSLPETSA